MAGRDRIERNGRCPILAPASAPTPAGPGLDELVSWLASGQGFAFAERPVTVVETHSSWVFMGRTLVLKFKKPVRFPFLDLTTLERRRRNCEAELRLNRRLAADVYRRLVAVRRSPQGGLTVRGRHGEIVEWLVEMRRLPSAEMLDARIHARRLTRSDAEAIATHLAGFYARAKPETVDGSAYMRHLLVEQAINREVLLLPSLGLAEARTAALLDDVDTLLARWRPVIEDRIAAGWIVEGHGDLRPGHICLLAPPRIFDCLEFNRGMRLLDPYDEVNYLGLECAMLGAGWMRPVLLRTLGRHLGHAPDRRLLAAYGAFRATLRARLSLAHLLDAHPREPARWTRQAQRYLALARREAIRASD